MILLDTTVLVYAVGEPHPLQEAARGVLGAARDGRLRAHTTPEVIQEFAHVRARRRSRADAADIAEAYAALLAPLQAVTSQHLAAGLDLWREHDGVGSFDAVLAAVALAVDATLVSADRAFGSIPGLRWHDLRQGADLLHDR